jgi:hypothetical protein
MFGLTNCFFFNTSSNSCQEKPQNREKNIRKRTDTLFHTFLPYDTPPSPPPEGEVAILLPLTAWRSRLYKKRLFVRLLKNG